MKRPHLFGRNLSIILHLLGWVLVVVVFFLLSPLSWRVELPYQFWVRQLIILAIVVSVFYSNIYYLVPQYLFKGKVWLFLTIVFFAGIGFWLMVQQYDQLVRLPEQMHNAFRPGEPYVPKPRHIGSDIYFFMLYSLSVGVGTSIAAVQKWQFEDLVRRQLEEQKVNSELSYLKAQINPHFFFNTLNNIYALTSFDVEKAKAALLKLSRMMRYVLYETERDNTLLSSEVNFIKDYLDLMRMRISEKVKLHIEIQEQFEDVVIAPMMLLPFIENAFKHGISGKHESFIVVKLKVQKSRLTLEVKNRITEKVQSSPESSHKGIGLANTIRRLSLIYSQNHSLAIDDQNDANEYRVYLSIDLK
ncbi:sensor histidine kinase [Pleomorphovibrio marinus]|uniref:sensor histidine kinase n=1 Tax=Pleomorphovibrio marinus TaxID=2164132 RepID=UPI000E0B3B41|nr:histidine kinase [Pleomorphovibrio marinus]